MDEFFAMKDKPETPKVGVGVIIRDKEGRILLLLRKGSHGAGLWSVPGGHMELGESFFDVCRREVMEEVEIAISSVNLITFTNDIFVDEGLHYVTLFFEAHWDQCQEPVNMEPDRAEKIKWFTVDELKNTNNVFTPLISFINYISFINNDQI